ncbi:MAG: efflux RND transporter periplasmic adaptor subunit [Rhodoferax sp.]|uniref:efflux RND transporter periplasmic adaptor subunit n=1 Tax=Rhodoferax sp. TaxID=50421 RepID=UPI001B5DAA23|nr:efflux RND transporter periplasmic adaptor subunit [Rhodoferax sp.]MBP9906740.1 efflux RND transporter periplasmic adaptor subunit [Rhodoferax sp.]
MNLKNLGAILAGQRRWLSPLLLFLVAALLWLGLRPSLVDSVTVQTTRLVRSVQFSARVATLARVEVGSTVTARVAQVLVREGEQVKAGDALVRLESDELQAALAQAQAAQIQAQARLLGLRSTGRAQTQASLAQAQATVHAAQADVARTLQLVAQGFLSPARLDEAQRALSVAQATQAGAAAQVQASTESGTDINQAQAQLEAARASTQAAQARLAQAVLRAPSDARVLARTVEPGQIVQPGRALLSLALSGPTQLKAQVDERFLAELVPGQPATVVADAFANQRLASKVAFIAPAVDVQRGAVEVTLTLDQPAPAFLREDMTLSVEVETARRDKTLTVPLAALRTALGAADDAADVLLAVDGRAQLQRIRLGVRSLQAVEVLDGLKAGDTLLLGNGVQTGQRVRVRDAATAPTASTTPGAPVATAGSAGAAGATLTNAMGR